MSYFLWYFHSAHQGVCTLQLYDTQHFFFFLSAHQSLRKQAPWLQAQRLPINIPSFHFLLCDLIKKRWGHDFWLLDSTCFWSNFAPHLSLMPREPLPPQPLCSAHGWADSSVGIVREKAAKHSHWPRGDFNEGHGLPLWPWHLCGAPPLIPDCYVCRCGLQAHLSGCRPLISTQQQCSWVARKLPCEHPLIYF